MIVFRSPRLRGRARLRVRRPGLSDREVASLLAPHTGDVAFAPVDPPTGTDAFADLPDAVMWPDGDEPEGAAA